MKSLKNVCIPFSFLILIFLFTTAYGEVTVSPLGFACALDADDEINRELILRNTGDEEVGFTIDFDYIRRDDQHNRGPRRDDPGDVLATYQAPYSNTGDMAYDGNLVWGVSYQHSRLFALNPEDGEIEIDIATQNRPLAMTFDGEYIWCSIYTTPTIQLFDLEGELVRNFDLNINRTFSMGSDREDYIYVLSVDDYLIHIVTIDDLEEIGTIDYRNEVNQGRLYSMDWVPEHPEGQLWGIYDGIIYQLYVDEDREVESVQQIQSNSDSNYSGPAHDGENMWQGSWNGTTWYKFDDGVVELSWITWNPEEGTIDSDDAEIINIAINAIDLEPETYEIQLNIEFDNPEQSIIEITALLSVDTPTWDLAGTITDAATDGLVEGVTINMDRYLITRFSDEDGDYTFDNLPLGEYEFTFTAPDYLPTVETIEIDRARDIELNIGLLHSECNPSRDEFFMELEAGQDHIFEFEVENGGNGTLVYQTERRLIGDADRDPWELRRMYDLEEITVDIKINGVVYIDGYYYISGGNNGEDVNKIHVLNEDGELVRRFDQFAESFYGIRDLTWDGDLIWGAERDNNIIYGFTTEGDLITTIEGDAPSYRSLTWDPDRSVFWSADITSNLYCTDPDGDLVEVIRRPRDLRTYGLSYWADDPDGYNLYVFSRGEEMDLGINKVNLENADVISIVELDTDGGRPAGIYITNKLDVYSWVLIGIVQNPDRLAIWQIESRREWFQVEPESGVIEAGETEQYTLTLDATDLPAVTFEGELVYTHDGIGGETILSVTLEVSDEEVHADRELFVRTGWNLISTNVDPDNDNVRVITRSLVDAGVLVMLKDSEGRFYSPHMNFNNIPGWEVLEGYAMQVSEDASFTIEGIVVAPNHPIPLEEGWQIVSYLPRERIPVLVALAGIAEHLIIAKDTDGHFYIPSRNFNNMADMREGWGYYMRL
ncbi:MAG: carboxypeptidase-like regulatory domain-containing protein, partial [Candidatus Hatepunaea meridiana]|nr:carboxypeptidase-like regulatory domain-containing protein [Candidatus Hatepunaea meridiana]